MCDHPLGVRRRAETQPSGQLERQTEANGDAFAVQQAAVVAVFRFQRMAKRVAQVQQRSAVVRLFLTLVVADDGGLEAQARLIASA